MRFILNLFIACLLFAPFTSLAHGPVTTLTQQSNGYTIEFEYNTLGSIFTGDYTIYDTYLLQNGQAEDFDSAFIRIEKKNGPAVIAASLSPSPDVKGYTLISSVINEAGNYTAELTFYKSGKSFADGKFDFEVKSRTNASPIASTSNNLLSQIGLFAIGLAMGAGGILWLNLGKKK